MLAKRNSSGEEAYFTFTLAFHMVLVDTKFGKADSGQADRLDWVPGTVCPGVL
jgi:hypothetical protein